LFDSAKLDVFSYENKENEDARLASPLPLFPNPYYVSLQEKQIGAKTGQSKK